MMCQPQLSTQNRPPKRHIFPQAHWCLNLSCLHFFWHRWDKRCIFPYVCVSVLTEMTQSWRILFPLRRSTKGLNLSLLSLCLNPVQKRWRLQPPKNIALSLSEATGKVFIFSIFLPRHTHSLRAVRALLLTIYINFPLTHSFSSFFLFVLHRMMSCKVTFNGKIWHSLIHLCIFVFMTVVRQNKLFIDIPFGTLNI